MPALVGAICFGDAHGLEPVLPLLRDKGRRGSQGWRLSANPGGWWGMG